MNQDLKTLFSQNHLVHFLQSRQLTVYRIGPHDLKEYKRSLSDRNHIFPDCGEGRRFDEMTSRKVFNR